MKTVYMDHAATTPVRPEVLEEMLPFFTERFGNASSVYGLGRDARAAVELARRRTAKALNAAREDEIYFTSGGTESDNWAVKGAALAASSKGKHIITTAIEHHAVLHTCAFLEKRGFEVTYLPVSSDGFVTAEQVEAALRPDTVLVSVMTANNEIGTIQPVAEIGRICRERGVVFHTDAVQAVGNISLDVQEMDIDLLSLSAHKIRGPKGAGALYVRKGVKIANLMHGGAQERARRGGTYNTPGIAGLGRAIELAAQEIPEHAEKVRALRDALLEGLMERIPDVTVNGSMKDRLPGNLNVGFARVESESVLLHLDLLGIAASSGSACTSGSVDPSHVLLAIGRTPGAANGSIRFSLGETNTQEDVSRVLEVLPGIVSRLREMSPFKAE